MAERDTPALLKDAHWLREALSVLASTPSCARDAGWQSQAIEQSGQAQLLLGQLRRARLRARGTNPVAVAEAHLFLAAGALERVLRLWPGGLDE